MKQNTKKKEKGIKKKIKKNNKSNREKRTIKGKMNENKQRKAKP